MAKTRTLVPKNGYVIGLIIVLVLATAYRLWRLTTLPSGLSPGEAQLGLAAYNLLHHGVWPSFSPATGGSPTLVVMEALGIWLFGLATWALRVFPALLGIVAVYTTYLWARDWFGQRTGILTAFLMAVTPWTVTLSRNAEPATLAVLLVTTLLWTMTRLWHQRTTLNTIIVTVVAVLAALSGPVGWCALVIALVCSLTVALSHNARPTPRMIAMWAGLGFFVVLPVLVIEAISKTSRSALVFGTSLGHYLGGVGTTILAFQIHGDDNYFHNLGGEPMLNVFVGIMFIAGILVTATRWKHRPDRTLLLGAAAALLPALIYPQTAPDAARLALMIPFALIFAAIGIGYMLEVWYATFPINSAARLTGQLAILLLLALTAYQGYTQYFVAWAGSTETHRAYSDAALGMASWTKQHAAPTGTLIITTPDDAKIIHYQLVKGPAYTIVDQSSLSPLLAARPLHLVIATAWRDQVVTLLKAGAPGGTLQAHQSSFDGADIYYTYDLP